MQHLALGLFELSEGHTGPSLSPVNILLDGSPALGVDIPKQLCVINKLAEGALNSIVHVATKMLKSAGPSTGP